MALQSSGSITLNQIKTYFGGPGNLKDYYRGGAYVSNAMLNQNISSSGSISLGQFYGAAIVSPGTVYDWYGNSDGSGGTSSFTIPNYNTLTFIVQGGGGGGYGYDLGDTGGDGGTSSIIASWGGTWISATGGGGCTSATPGAGGSGGGQYDVSGGGGSGGSNQGDGGEHGGNGASGAAGGARGSPGSWPSGGGGGYGGPGGGGGGYASSNWTPGSGGPWPGQVVTINVGGGGSGGGGGGGPGAPGRVQIIVS